MATFYYEVNGSTNTLLDTITGVNTSDSTDRHAGGYGQNVSNYTAKGDEASASMVSSTRHEAGMDC